MNLMESIDFYFKKLMESIEFYSKKLMESIEFYSKKLMEDEYKRRELKYHEYKTVTTIFELIKLILFPVVLIIPYIIFENLCKYFDLKFKITN